MELEKIISDYISGIQNCSNEEQKKQTFIVFLSKLFPEKEKQISQLTQGAEKFVKYKNTPDGERTRGRIDSFYGNLVIEFENDLTKTGEHAEDQLREYVAKLWSSEFESNRSKTDYLCMSSDGLKWNLYTPKLINEELTSSSISKNEILLIKNEPFNAKTVKAGSFYEWLDRVFFRENSIHPSGTVVSSEFGWSSFHYTKSYDHLLNIYNRAKPMKELQVIFNNWQQYLKYTYGDVDASEQLFVTHTYLSGLTKILMALVLSSRKNRHLEINDLKDVLTGQFFIDLNIRNYVERDFFYWVNFEAFSKSIIKIWEATFQMLRTYDFSRIDNDFLKELYQGLIHPEERHKSGEFYTPDWLCEKIVIESLKNRKEDGEAPRIADITCGSGSFLRIAIHEVRRKYFSNSKEKSLTKNEVLKFIVKNIIGFEIHPLAAFIAKTNYMLALENLLAEADEPIHIPIYLCDSLLNSEVVELDLLNGKKFSVRLADDEILFPQVEALTDERFDSIVDYIDKVAHEYKNDNLSEIKIRSLLEDKIREFLILAPNDREATLNSFVLLTQILHEKVRNHENTIWSFVLKNNFRPIMFRNSFDLIVGNPPWLSFRHVTSPKYRKELEDLGLRKYQIAPATEKLRTHMELATIFLAHAVDCYLRNKGSIYFVLPRSLFSADHHSRFREQTYSVDMKIKEIWDLDGTKPVFRIPCCVVVANRDSKVVDAFLPGRSFSGTLSAQNIDWGRAKDCVVEKNIEFYLVRMANRTAFSTTNSGPILGDRHYVKLFKQGATIVPRNYYFVEVSSGHSNAGVVPVKTSEVVAKNSKKPYKDVRLSGRANKEFLFTSVLAENILPFAVVNPFKVHLPVIKQNEQWREISVRGLLDTRKMDSSDWFRQVEESYKELSSNKMTWFERINFHNGLLAQNPEAKYWVLYCAAGTHVCASVYENSDRFWVEHKNYYYCPETEIEAYYLVGVLNSDLLNSCLKPFQTKGLKGERDIEKKVLDIGIPRFESGQELMANISNKAKELTKAVNSELPTYKTVGKNRSAIRSRFKKEFGELEVLVKQLF